MVYLLTAVGLTPGGSSTEHIHTHKIHRSTKWDGTHRTHITIKVHKRE
jgi:hypothetical protein